MKFRYVELDINRIFNRLAPDNHTAWCKLPKKWRNNWWDLETIKIRQFFASVWMSEFDRLTNHFHQLRKSIKNNGILHPISVVTGQIRNVKNGMKRVIPINNFIPPQYQQDPDSLIYTQPFGGSRLVIAKELGIEKIPCLIHDYSNLFPDGELVNKTNIKQWIGDYYMFTNTPPCVRIKKHLHLNNSKFDTTTRKNQRIASTIATQKTIEKYD